MGFRIWEQSCMVLTWVRNRNGLKKINIVWSHFSIPWTSFLQCSFKSSSDPIPIPGIWMEEETTKIGQRARTHSLFKKLYKYFYTTIPLASHWPELCHISIEQADGLTSSERSSMPLQQDWKIKPLNTQTSKCRGWGVGTFKSFYQMSSVFMVKNAVKLSAESEGVGMKDNEEIWRADSGVHPALGFC